MSKELFIKELLKMGINITNYQLQQLEKYYEMLIEWNNKINLTTITKKEEVYLKHFYDSLTLSLVYDLTQPVSLCDVGTGAGFPGLVLKIMFPNLKVTLLDSLQKRLNFLDEVIKELHLGDIITVHARVEDYAKTHRDCFDLVTSRAVARLSILDELCLPLVKKSGYFIPMKAIINNEIDEALRGLKILNSSIELIKEILLPIENSVRTLIKIKRIGNIDKKYPRKFEEIKRKPL